MTPDVNVVLIDFHEIRGNEFVVENEDGSFTVAINSRLSNDGQLKAYNHAMEHIKNNDFQKHDVQTIEASAHHQTIASTPEDKLIPSDLYLKRIRRRKKRLQREWKKFQEVLDFIGYDETRALAKAEHYKLYGNDL